MYELSDICMVIVLFNPDASCIDKIDVLSKSLTRILIVDNGSDDSSIIEILKAKHNSKLEVICNNDNKGIAYALNQGLEYSEQKGFPLLITMDQDSIINIDTIKKLAAAIDVVNGVISVGPYYDTEEHDTDKVVTNLITSGNMLHVQSVKKIGGFCEKLFIDCVDIDLSFNIFANNLVMKKIAGTHMVHKIGEYENSRIFHFRYLSHSPKRFFFKVRNNIYIYKTYAAKLPKLCLKLGCLCIIEILKVIFIERDKKEKLEYIAKGIQQGFGLKTWSNKYI